MIRRVLAVAALVALAACSREEEPPAISPAMQKRLDEDLRDMHRRTLATRLGDDPPVAARPPVPAGPDPSLPESRSQPPAPEPEARVTWAGGRPLPWWNERLARLRADGPQPLYDLTVQRAKANGLRVVEADGKVRVEAPEETR
jgi:hypothetical protein